MFVELGSVPVAAAVVGVPAQDPAPPPQGEEFGKSSPVGLVIILLLALATIALIVNMTKRIRRLPASFDEPGAEQPGDEQEKSTNGAGDGGERRP